MAENKITIGIADMKMAKGQDTLITYALGSCIGICLYDPLLKLGALIHIMLPLNMETGRKNTMKYADTGIRETIKMMEAKGASRARMTAKIAGGAKMFEISGDIDTFTQTVWNSLNPDNKVSLFVRYISLKDKSVQTRIVNKNI